jgi:stage II sporulation protein D
VSFIFLTAPVCFAQDVAIGVLGLFHPREITLSAASNDDIVITATDKTFVLDSGASRESASIRFADHGLVLNIHGQSIRTKEVRAAGRGNDAVAIQLGVPGKITRRYHGTLVVKAEGELIVPVVSMDLETAVASAVASESMPGTPMEALKAQAVVSRSYFFAGKGRHHNFDFCDLTHCQFLREPPPPESDVATAVAATRGLILRFDDKPIATMFTRSCSGKTRTPAELKMLEGKYPYFAVVCDYCRKHPVQWIRRISPEDATQLIGKGEAGRLAVDRKLGWEAIPSNNFTARAVDGQVVLEGAGQGHGIGLCQRGARGMARDGIGFREILRHYFPNTTLTPL